jgi:NAD dependent epimerase/dehydratase family enzyme
VPAFAIRALYGQMAEIVTEGQRVIPRRTQELGYRFEQTELEPALRDAVAS